MSYIDMINYINDKTDNISTFFL